MIWFVQKPVGKLACNFLRKKNTDMALQMEIKLPSSTCKWCKYPRFPGKSYPAWIGLMLDFLPPALRKFHFKIPTVFELQGCPILLLQSRQILYICDFKGKMKTRKLKVFHSPVWRSLPTSRPLPLKTCVIPTCLKCSRITPFHNLWTISPASVVTKMFERLVMAYMKDVTETLLYVLQFEHWSNRSVDDTVILELHYIFQHLECLGVYATWPNSL